MMYQKALLFSDDYASEKILSTTDVSAIKKLGREVKNYDDSIWNGMRQIIVYKGLLEEFSQNHDFKKQL